MFLNFIKLNKGEKMSKMEKEKLCKMIDEFTLEFWTMDCLIRMIKEILTNDNWETREEDIYYIAITLVKSSKLLLEQIQELKLILT